VPALVAPQLEDQVAEPVDHGGCGVEPGGAVDESQGLEPARHAVELAELGLERSEDRQTGEPGSFVALLDGELGADLPLHPGLRPIDGAVPRDVRDVAADPDQIEPELHPRRGRERPWQLEPELGETLLEPAHGLKHSPPSPPLHVRGWRGHCRPNRSGVARA
jgi:hypothetical protein